MSTGWWTLGLCGIAVLINVIGTLLGALCLGGQWVHRCRRTDNLGDSIGFSLFLDGDASRLRPEFARIIPVGHSSWSL